MAYLSVRLPGETHSRHASACEVFSAGRVRGPRWGTTPVMGAVHLFCAPDGSPLARALRATLTGPAQDGIDATTWIVRYAQASSRSRPAPRVHATLTYRDRQLLRLIGAAGDHAAGSAPFAGGDLRHEWLRATMRAEDADATHDAPVYDCVIVIQPPPLSPLESCVTTRVPGDVAEINTDTTGRAARSGITAPLLALPGGWAVGGMLAAKLLRAWRDGQKDVA